MNDNPFSFYQNRKEIKDKQVDQLYQQKEVAVFEAGTGLKNKFQRLTASTKKVNYFTFLIGICLCIILIRLFYLQVAQGDYYRGLAEDNRIRLQTIKASRGIIFDRDYNPLVENVPNFILTINPLDFSEDEDAQSLILGDIAKITQVPHHDLKQRLTELPSKQHQTFTLLELIPYNQALKLMTQANYWPGVEVKALATRQYLNDSSLAHVMGYTGKINAEEVETHGDKYLLTDYLGKSGIELFYEDLLRGKDGKKQIEVNAQGKEKNVIAEEKPVAGKNVVLTIDPKLQAQAAESLQKYIEQRDAPGGVAIAMDPRQGEILSMVTLPSFDNNKFVQGISQKDYQELIENEAKPLFNRPVTGTYPPGSTFKPVVAAAALQEGVVTPDTIVSSTGGIEINAWYFPDWKSGGHGQTDVRKALAESVNTYFYLAGGGTYNQEKNEIEGGLGVDRINQYAKLFGFDELTGIDLPGEKNGFLPSKEWKEETKDEYWYIGDTYHLAIGQGDILVTPMQLTNATSVFANQGTLYQPHLLKSVINEKNEIVQNFESSILRNNFIDNYYLQVVREGMQQAVISGSAKALQALPVSAGAKTGTAQIGGTDRTHSWFTCFAPYENPEIVVTVLVEEGGEGTEAALPVSLEILQAYFNQE